MMSAGGKAPLEWPPLDCAMRVGLAASLREGIKESGAARPGKFDLDAAFAAPPLATGVGPVFRS